MGGKHAAAEKLIALFPEHTCYVEVFGGAANVLFAKERSKSEVLNDLNDQLVNVFRVIRWHPDEFFAELRLILHSRTEFNDCHDQPGLTDIQRAVRYFYRLKTSFGGTGVKAHKNFSFGTCRKATFNTSAEETIEQAHRRLDGVCIENDDFEKIIKRYDRSHTFFFVDPPYWQTADYGIKFDWTDHTRLKNNLASIKGKFLLTINNHDDIVELYRDFYQQQTKVRYTVCHDDHNQQVTELIITNYPLKR